jgi:hypothetical protein
MIKMVRGWHQDLSHMLPVDAWLRRMRLTLVDPKQQADPVYLIDPDGRPVREWDYIPSMAEIDDACRKVKYENN